MFSLKSKKIPEEIGFPRLLLSKQANVLNGLTNYSIAKYFNGKLAKQHGEFHFPTNLSFLKTIRGNKDFIEYGEYNHFVLFKGSETAVVLSEKTKTNYDVLTSFSYVFCFWGLLLVLININILLFLSFCKHFQFQYKTGWFFLGQGCFAKVKLKCFNKMNRTFVY